MRHTRPPAPRSTGPPYTPPKSGIVPLAEQLFLLLEDPSHFGRYLARLPPESRAGVIADGRRCPLARFLNAMADAGGFLEVGAERVFVPDNLDEDGGPALPVAPLPYWAQLFVESLDGSARPDDEEQPPTAGRVHELLDEGLLLAIPKDPGQGRGPGPRPEST